MQTFIQKISSRKLWLAIVGAVGGIAIALGVSSSDVSTITTAASTIIGGLTALASIVTYIRTEGKLDTASIQKASTSAQSIVEAAQTIIDRVQGEADTSNANGTMESEAADENAG